MATITEVAKLADVSIATVSNVIRGTRTVSPELGDRVRAAIKKLNYSPNELARSLKLRQTRMLAVVIPDITNPFFPETIRGAEDAALERGYFLLTANTNEEVHREKRIIEALRAYRVDGILLAPTSGTDIRHLQQARRAGVPIVCVDRSVPGLGADAVLLDNVGGSRECVLHLIRKGHRRIATVTGPLSVQTGGERFQGYEQALREEGIPIKRNLIVEGNFHFASGYEAAKRLMTMKQRPTAIFSSNGVMALGLLSWLEEAGMTCPGDVELATFSHLTAEASSQPPMTTVVQPSYEIGTQAATVLIDRIEGRLPQKRVVVRVSPTLVIRDPAH